jgi:hypothetical protein
MRSNMTQNLGTKAGPLINQGGLIAGDAYKKPRSEVEVSEYAKYFGTYSGADIKVVVHYPYDATMEKALQRVKAEAEAELAAEEATFWAERGGMNSKQFADAIERLQVIRGEIDQLDGEISSAKNVPTSKTLGEIQTISVGSYRDKAPVRPLGSVYPRGYTRGARSISGSMVFTIFHEHVFHELMRLNLNYYSTGSSDFDRYIYSTVLIDQLPPIDISMVFANEYGAISHMGLYGVEFFQEGMTFSIEDIYSESVVQYVARDFDPLRMIDQREIDGHGVSDYWSNTASDMLRENQIVAYRTRRDPFI